MIKDKPPAIIHKKTCEWVADINAIESEEGWEETLTTLLRSLLKEFLDLADNRGRTGSACLSAAKQINDKWNAIARKVKRGDRENLAEDGFLNYLDEHTSGKFRMHLSMQKFGANQKREKARF